MKFTPTMPQYSWNIAKVGIKHQSINTPTNCMFLHKSDIVWNDFYNRFSNLHIFMPWPQQANHFFKCFWPQCMHLVQIWLVLPFRVPGLFTLIYWKMSNLGLSHSNLKKRRKRNTCNISSWFKFDFAKKY